MIILDIRRRLNGVEYLFFSAWLNKELDEIWRRILGRGPLPSVGERFSEVHGVEAQRHVMLKGVEEPRMYPNGSALVACGNDQGDRHGGGKQRPWWDYCRKPWHTRKTCWKLHEEPANLKKKHSVDAQPADGTRAFQVSHTNPEH